MTYCFENTDVKLMVSAGVDVSDAPGAAGADEPSMQPYFRTKMQSEHELLPVSSR